jgi:hypothetical protein
MDRIQSQNPSKSEINKHGESDQEKSNSDKYISGKKNRTQEAALGNARAVLHQIRGLLVGARINQQLHTVRVTMASGNQQRRVSTLCFEAATTRLSIIARLEKFKAKEKMKYERMVSGAAIKKISRENKRTNGEDQAMIQCRPLQNKSTVHDLCMTCFRAHDERIEKNETTYPIFAFKVGALGHERDNIVCAAIFRGFKQLEAFKRSKLK